MTAGSAAIALDPSVEDLCGRLSAISEQLSGPRQTIEQTFLDMGHRLLECTRLLNDVTAAYAGMPAALDSAAFNTAARALETIRSQVATLAARHADERRTIGRLIAMAEHVSTPVTDLRRTVRTIRLIAVNARIVVAGLHGLDGDFAVLTTDMADLSRNVEGAVADFVGSYERLTTTLTVARGASAAFSARHGGTLAAISGQIDAHLMTVDHYRARAAQKAREHEDRTGQLRSGVSAAVAALQIGDITRQRIEHVEQALAALGAGLDGNGRATCPAGNETLSMVSRLEAAQVEEAIDDFVAQVGGLATSLGGLADDAGAMMRAGNDEAEVLLSAGGTALGAINNNLKGICALFDDFEATHAELDRVAGDVALSLTGMIGHLEAIRAIERQVRMLGFNIAIQCTRIGDDGRALRVVARNLQELAGETVAAAGAIMSGLAEADATARLLAEHHGSETAGDLAALKDEAGTAIASFEIVARRLRDHAAVMAKAGPRAVDLLRNAAGDVSGRRDFCDDWRAALIRLQALASSCPEAPDAAALDATLIACLRALYTMDSERRLHDRLLGRAGEGMDDTPPSDDAAALDDIFF